MPAADIDRRVPQLRRSEMPTPLPSPFAPSSVAGLALDLALFAPLTTLAAMPPDRANAITYGLGLILGFALRQGRRFADASGDAAEVVTRLVVVSLASLLLSTMIVGALATAIPALLAKLLSLPMMFLWRYGMTRRFFLRRES
ncbi:MAG TPA: GtrA family protein [Stellaceae bacterium]|nr:GtrA family protein [Stellaceae bacterium]